MGDKGYGRYNPKYGKDKKGYGRYNPNAYSIEKYGGDQSTLAIYCADYGDNFPKDWRNECISYSEANTSYAMNVLKSYAYGDKKHGKTIACYCGLYVFKHAKKLGYKCNQSKVWLEFGDCTIEYCTKSGIKCTRKDDCVDGGFGSGLWFIFFIFFVLFLLIIFALGRR